VLTLEQLSDRQEIEDLIAAYSDAIDRSDWDALDEIFAADAVIDYTEVGGPCGDLPTIKAYLRRVMPGFKSFQHLTGSTRLTLDGDAARARSIVFNPIVLERAGVEEVMFVGLWYRDVFTRTIQGWRIQTRSEERCYLHNMPAWFVQQPA
jgi:hypothetical protein